MVKAFVGKWVLDHDLIYLVMIYLNHRYGKCYFIDTEDIMNKLQLNFHVMVHIGEQDFEYLEIGI